MVNVRTFRWDRALQLAQKHNTHVPTVLLERRKHLAKAGKSETHKAFQQSNSEVKIDEALISQQVQQEALNEAARPDAVSYA